MCAAQKAEDMPVTQIKDFGENEQWRLSAELKSPLAVTEWLFNQYYYRAEASLTHSWGKHTQGHPQSLCFRRHHVSMLSLKKANWGTVHGQSEAQRAEFPPLQSVIPTQWLAPAPPPPCSNTWYVLNTLSGSQHVFSLQFFISNIHLGFGLLSNAMWMESRCLFWTQQNKRRVTEPILPQSKLVLTTTPTVGDRLCGTGPMLI